MKDKDVFEVSIYLHANQYIEINKWAFSINGEQRVATQRTVSFMVDTLQQAVDSINEDECDKITIKSIRIYGI